MPKKKEVPEIRKVLGIFDNILATLFRKMDKAGLSEEDFHRLSMPEGEAVLDKLVEFMVETSNIFTALVCYDRSITEKNANLLKTGKLTYVNDGVVNYSIDNKLSIGPIIIIPDGKKQVRFKLVPFNPEVSCEQGRDELAKMGLRPALPTEGNDFLSRNFKKLETRWGREPGKTMQIAMLSSALLLPPLGDPSAIAFFYLSNSSRHLHLHYFNDSWRDPWYALAVCEE